MRYFAYLGDHAKVTLYGVTFVMNVPTPVTNPFLIKKLLGNNHFAEVLEPIIIIRDTVEMCKVPAIVESAPYTLGVTEKSPESRKRGRPPKIN